MMSNKLSVKTIAGIEIFVGDDGKFSAEIDKTIYRRTTLRSIEKLIEEKVAAPLPVITTKTNYQWDVRKDQITGIVRKRLHGESGGSYDAYGNVFVYDEQAMKRFEDLLQRYLSLKKEWHQLEQSLTRVDVNSFEEIRSRFFGGES